MTRGPVDAYLERLERELRHRGVEDARIAEEAREHLLDAVEDGRQRGLSADDAEREALERFGATETVLAHVVPARHPMMNRFALVLDTVWRRKWWVLAPTVLTAVLTSVASYYFLPTRYRSESIIRITRVPDNVPEPGRAREPLQEISLRFLNRTRLERIISEFGLYQAGQTRAHLDELVERMRRDISINVLTPDYALGDGVGGFNVSFVSSDRILAMKITERLAGEFIEENVSRSYLRESTIRFLDSQAEKALEALRAQNGRRTLSHADLLPDEVLKERYKALVIRGERLRIDANIVQFRIIDPPRLPALPIGPSRLAVNIVGTFAGLSLGLVFVGVRGRSKQTSG